MLIETKTLNVVFNARNRLVTIVKIMTKSPAQSLCNLISKIVNEKKALNWAEPVIGMSQKTPLHFLIDSYAKGH